MKGGQYDNAIADFNKNIELKPDSTDGYNSRGNAYEDKDQYERAIQDYNQAIHIDSKYSLAYYNRGLAYNHLGDFDLAIEDFSQYIAKVPDDSDGYRAAATPTYERANTRGRSRITTSQFA